ncbi:F-box domain-containing protein [Mycena venus]|uniref:F-box domain-containing protein n=1 Tax=Mycena venus TaxID=2733690 RepID=A0A8H6XA05_9AGAR|nr:F-box domain-containing protein [Mycena venus]
MAIHRLPIEILSEIFLHCSTKQDGCKPRLVATVCRRWRHVALSTSQLWCNIHLNAETIEVESLRSLLVLQLQRSGQVPLSIVFREPRDTASTLQLLLTVSQRWQSLDLLILTASQHELIRTSTSLFPVLKKLTLRNVTSFELGNLFRPLPLLEELVLDWLECPLPSTLPWTRITKCDIYGCSSEEVLNVLHSAPSIVNLSLYDCHVDNKDLTTITSAIRSLTISHCTSGFARSFLNHLTVPNLQELVLDLFRDINALTSLLTRSSSPIARLILTSVDVSEQELIATLHLTDTLDHLEINWPSDVHSNTLMEALTILPRSRRAPLLPRLRVLSITGGLSCRDDVLLTMLQSRCPGLEHVELYYAGRTFFFDRAFDGLRKIGMKMTVLLDGPVDPFAEEVEEMGD